jgi:hypothetical protein
MVVAVVVEVLQTLMEEPEVLVAEALLTDPVAALIQREFLVGLACGMSVKPLLLVMVAEAEPGVQVDHLLRDAVDLE